MKKTPAYINHGRWLVKCPDCGSASMVELYQAEYICSSDACYTDMRALAQVPVRDEQRNVTYWRPIADHLLREEALKRATAAGDIIKITWPKGAEQYMDILRPRPVANMNWEPHESLHDLQVENQAHKVGG